MGWNTGPEPKAKQPQLFQVKAVFADRTGLEPATSAVTGRHSNQLNYRSVLPFGNANIGTIITLQN
jgi:hypothetical protein